jgi:hypothetical protein
MPSCVHHTVSKTLRAGLMLVPFLAAGTVGCGVQGSAPGTGQAGATGSAGGPGSAGASGVAGNAAGSAGDTGSAGNGGGTAGAPGTGGTSPGAAGAPAGTAGAGPGTAGTPGAAGGGAAGSSGAAGAGTAGAPPPSGITINIGGVNVPKEDVIAFVNFGHSNMAGRGVSPAELRPYFFGPGEMHSLMYHSGAGFQPAVEPKTAGDSGNTLNGMVSGGPSTALVKEAAALNPSKYFVSIPFGAGKAYCSQFLPGAGYYNNVITAAKELKGKVTFGAIVILLGITERHGTQADIDNYPMCINKLVTAIRTDLGEPNLPLLINDYEMGTTGPLAPTSAFAMAIRPKIQMVPMFTTNAVVIPTDNPIISIQDDTSTTDDHHFDLAGHKEYVRRVLQTMKDKGWAPWLTP